MNSCLATNGDMHCAYNRLAAAVASVDQAQLMADTASAAPDNGLS